MNKLELQVQANSPYNDGWTKQSYQEQLDKMTVNTEAYLEFVNAVTSKPSQDHEAFV